MPRLLAFAVILAFLGACSSGGGCDGGSPDNKPSSGSSGGGGGGAGPAHGGTGESVSFQGLGRKTGGAPASSDPQAAAAALNGEGAKPAPAAVAGNTAGSGGAPQSVICGGFPYLAADCKTDPVFEQIQKKCCPTGQVTKCEAIPGGARLTGTGCTATPK